MFVKIFRKNYHFLLILLFVYGVLLWLKAFIYPALPDVSVTAGWLYKWIHPTLLEYPYLSTITAYGLLFLQAVLLNNLVTKHALSEKVTYLPAFMYITLMSLWPSYTMMHKLLIAHFFILLAVDKLLNIYSLENIRKHIFDIGILLSVASLFYVYAAYYILFVWISLLLYKTYSIRLWLISIAGFILPYIFIVFYFFWTDNLTPFLELVHLPALQQFDLNWGKFSVWAAIMLQIVLLISAVKYKLLDKERNVMLRKYASILMGFYSFTIISLMWVSDLFVHMPALFIPTAVFFSTFLLNVKKKWVGELLVLAIVILALINHFLMPFSG